MLSPGNCRDFFSPPSETAGGGEGGWVSGVSYQVSGSNVPRWRGPVAAGDKGGGQQ
jgi:hypothetical protein